jgi:hypothetical protein
VIKNRAICYDLLSQCTRTNSHHSNNRKSLSDGGGGYLMEVPLLTLGFILIVEVQARQVASRRLLIL